MEGVLSNSFHKASIILIVRPAKDLTEMENYRPSFPVGIHAKNCTKIIVFQSTSKELFIMINRVFIPGIQEWFSNCDSGSGIYHAYGLKERNHRITSADA